MLKTLLVGIVLLFVAIVLMGVKVFFFKKGAFPNTHIGGSKAMRERGIGCATSQDAQMNAKISPVEEILKSDNL